MRFLADSNILSELTKPAPDSSVVEWVRANEAEIVLSAVVLGEIEYGILRLPPGPKRRLLHQWFTQRIRTLNVLDFDAPTASKWAELLAKLNRNSTPMPIKDSLIAATALRHDLTVVTRNTSDFARAGVPIFNPFSGSSA